MKVAAQVRLVAGSVAVEFKTPLFLPARVSLWTTRDAQGARFEVRNAKGDRPHLRGHLHCGQA